MNHWDEDKETLARFVSENRLQQRVLLYGNSVGKDWYGVVGVPSSFWIDRAGIVVDSHIDFEGPEVLERKTKKLLARP